MRWQRQGFDGCKVLLWNRPREYLSRLGTPQRAVQIDIYQLSQCNSKFSQVNRLMKILLNYMQESERGENGKIFMFYNKPFTIEQDIYVLLDHPQLILICDQCERNLNSASSILLIKKPQERKDLCFTCFYNTKDLDPNFYYYVRPNLNVTLTDPKWNILSDLKLLNGMQKYGYGNWTKVKNYLDYHASNFTEDEIEGHYKQFYMLNSDREPILHECPLAVSEPNRFTPPKSKHQKIPETKAEKQEGAIAGYNPKRQEHLFDYDPEAENLVANLEFLQQDTPQETELKYQLLEEYNRRIIEREKRQRFVIQHRLLSEEHTRKLLAQGKIKSSVRQEIACFSRYMSFEESENIVNYLTLQKTLSGTIRQYMRQRRRFEEPTFEQAYQAMEAVRQKRNQKFYSGAPQLKVHLIGNFQGKRSMSVQPRLSCEQARKRLKLTNYYKDSMKITDISG